MHTGDTLFHKMSCKYSHVEQSYSNFEFSVAAIFKIQNGGRYSSQIFISYMILTIKKLSIHKMSCFYDNLNNLATNRSTMYIVGAIVYHQIHITNTLDQLSPGGTKSKIIVIWHCIIR